MSDFAWATASVRQQHFASPRFTEFVPVNRSTGAGESPPIDADPFDHAVLSWNGDGSWRLEMRLRIDGKWTPYYLLGVLNGNKQRSATRAERTMTGAAFPVVPDVDTLALRNGATATGFQVRATGTGNLRSLCVAHYRRTDCRFTDRPAVSGAWGTVLLVPERRQGDVKEEPIGGLVCSPTSMSMILDYHGSRYRTIDVAHAVQDGQTGIYGNWPCNTAAAARLLKPGGWSAVVKMTGFDEVEPEIAARRPVALSHRWQRGDLTNAPISASSGHLIVAVGFTADGDVVVNDPASKPGEIRRIYKRAELFRTWQQRGSGIAYLVQPGK